jgi:metal-dependent HD superfamily phosphatase/phosphodiesterase
MTPKEKAWKLMDQCIKFHRNGIYNQVHEDIAKQYALMIVDEILKLDLQEIYMNYDYWIEVKQEIEKL